MTNEFKPLIVIAFSGPKGCGKTFLSKHSCEIGIGRSVHSFATRLKSFAKKYLGLTDAQVFGNDKETPFTGGARAIPPSVIRRVINAMYEDLRTAGLPEKDNFNPSKISVSKLPGGMFKTPREVLQFLGTELIQNIYKPYSPLVTVLPIKNLQEGTYFIDDMRFPLEDEILKKHIHFYYPVRIIGRNEVSTDNHVSEHAWKEIKFFAEVDSSGTLEELYNNMMPIYQKIKDDVTDRIKKGDIPAPDTDGSGGDNKISLGKGRLGLPERVPVRW